MGMQAKYQMENHDGSIIKDSYDGHLMWQDLRALIDVQLLESKLKRHQTELERLHDSRLPDNVSAEEWAARMVEFQEHNEHVDVPYEQKRFSKAMLGMLPKGLDVDRRDMERTIESRGLWDDVLEVNKMIMKILDSSHEPDAAPLALAGAGAAYVTEAQTAELLRRAPTMAMGGPRRGGSAKGGKAGGQPKRSSAAAVLAAIDATRVVCQRTELGGESDAAEAPAQGRAPLRHKCGRGHVLQEAAFDATACVV